MALAAVVVYDSMDTDADPNIDISTDVSTVMTNMTDTSKGIYNVTHVGASNTPYYLSSSVIGTPGAVTANTVYWVQVMDCSTTPKVVKLGSIEYADANVNISVGMNNWLSVKPWTVTGGKLYVGAPFLVANATTGQNYISIKVDNNDVVNVKVFSNAISDVTSSATFKEKDGGTTTTISTVVNSNGKAIVASEFNAKNGELGFTITTTNNTPVVRLTQSNGSLGIDRTGTTFTYETYGDSYDANLANHITIQDRVITTLDGKRVDAAFYFVWATSDGNANVGESNGKITITLNNTFTMKNVLLTVPSCMEISVTTGTFDATAMQTPITLNGSISLTAGAVFKGTLQNTSDDGTINSITSVSGITAGTGGLILKHGSIVMNGIALTPGANNTITITGNATLDDDTTVQNLVIAPGATLSIPTGKTLTIRGDVVNDGALEVTNGATLATDGNDATITGNPVAAAEGSIVPTGVETVVIGGSDNLGLKGTLESNLDVTKNMYLENDLVIAEGVTLKITSKGSLELNGHQLKVLGTLDVEKNGTITAAANGSILLGVGGNIVNNGVIGSASTVTVAVMPDPKAASASYTQYENAGQVLMRNVMGISFDLKKEVSSVVKYTLVISGDMSKKGDSALLSATNVIISGDASIDNIGTTFSNVKLAKSATLEIGSKATATGTVTLGDSAIIDINGNVTNLRVSGITCSYVSGTTAPTTTTTIAVNEVKGISIYTDSYTYVDSNDQTNIVKTLNMSGTAAEFVKDETPSETIAISTTATTNGGIVIDQTLVINDGVSFTAAGNAKVAVKGTLILDNADEIPDELKAQLAGVGYTLESKDETGAKTYTSYVTNFKNAFEKIASAYQNTIEVYGIISTSSEITIEADMTVSTYNTSKVIVGEEGKITVKNDAEIGNVDVEGILVVEIDGTTGTISGYAAVATDDEGTETYSGFSVAINNANPGDVIKIVKAVTVEDSITIGNGVTIEVSGDGSLTFEKDLTIADGVKVILKDDRTLTMSGHSTKLTVQGELDVSEGALAFPADDSTDNNDVQFRSPGKTIVSPITSNEVTINAAYYVNDDGKTVYTSVAAAAQGAASMDLGKTFTVAGMVSEGADVTLSNKVTMNIADDSKVTLGKVALSKDAIIHVEDSNVEFSATMVGYNGIDAEKTESIVKVTKTNTMDFTTTSKTNAQGDVVWTTTLTDAAIAGKVVITSGEVLLGSDTTTVSEYDNNTFTVDSAATLVVGNGKALSISNDGIVTIDGKMIVNGTVSVAADYVSGPPAVYKYGCLIINGNVEVIKNEKNQGAATLTVAGIIYIEGTLTISDDENRSGSASIDGENNIKAQAFVGVEPESLGATGVIVGEVTIADNAYLISYPGSDLTASKINWNDVNNESEAVSTKVVINDSEYCTIYAQKDNNITIIGNIITANIEISGLNTENLGNINYWFTDVEMKTSIESDENKIGAVDAIYYDAPAALVGGKISAGTGLQIYIDGLSVVNFEGDYGDDYPYYIPVGTHKVTINTITGYDGSAAYITFNGQKVTNGQIEITADMAEFVLTATGAVPAVTPTPEPTPIQPSEKDDSMGITEYLLIVLVILAAILVVVVAIRMMRS